MTSRELFYRISPASDSTLIAQVFEKRGMGKRRYFLSFEKFEGELQYSPDHLERCWLTLEIDATSLICRDRTLRASRQQRVTTCARDVVLQAHQHPVIGFSSARISAKVLRGLAVEGTLRVGGTTRPHKVNAVLTPVGADRLEIEGDSLFRFSAFDMPAPSSRFGVVRTDNEVLIHWHLYATPAVKGNRPSE